LSNNQQSPFFTAMGDDPQQTTKVINFDATRKVKKVQAVSRGDSVSRVSFLDDADHEIDYFDPRNQPRAGAIHEVGENEELIGVYGISHRDYVLSSFGFIVLVRNY